MTWLRGKSVWLLLIASLAFNVGVGTTFGVRTYQHYRKPCERGRGPGHAGLLNELNLTPDQVEQTEAIKQKVFEGARYLRRELKQESEILAGLIAAPQPDREAITVQLGRISALHEQKLRQVVEHFLDIKELLDSEQCEAFNETIHRVFLRGRLGRPGFGGHHGPHGRPDRGGEKPFHDNDG